MNNKKSENHMNIYGARKATLDIAKELEKNNILTDYKTKNDLWAKDLELYLKQLKKYNVHFEDVT